MRLIDADELRKHAFWECYDNPDYDYQYVTIDQINYAPTIEAEKHGRWININEGKWNTMQVLQCSACGEIDNRMYLDDSYCPNCGAKMDGKDERKE